MENIREDDDICAALYNSLFQQIVTVFKSGFVTVHLLAVKLLLSLLIFLNILYHVLIL